MRLESDFYSLSGLRDSSDFIDFTASGSPPDRYVLRFTCRGLTWDSARNEPVESEDHKVQLDLHSEYPRRPPYVQMLTPIFHPNMLSPERGGGVCFNATIWSPQEKLNDFVLRLGHMIQYKNYWAEPTGPRFLDSAAASWARQNVDRLPIDSRDLIRDSSFVKVVTDEDVEIRIL
jgi:hypothetical protein